VLAPPDDDLETGSLGQPLAGDEGVAGDEEAPFVERGAGDVDAGSGGDGGRDVAVGGDIEGAGGRAEVAGVVALAGDTEGLGEASGARGEEAKLGGAGRGGEGETTEGGHGLEAADGLDGAQKDASGVVRGLATDVGAVMIAVDEIDVGVAGRPEEDGVARGLATVSVSTGVNGSEVGLGFDDASGEEDWFLTFLWSTVFFPTFLFPRFAKRGRMWATLETWTDEQFAEEVAGDEAGIAGVEGARE